MSTVHDECSFRDLAIALAAFCTTMFGQALSSAATPTGEWRYEIVREGSNIGSHSIQFSQSGTRLDVQIDTNVAVKVTFVVVYRYSHTGHESWENGRLIALETTTDDDGDRHRVIAGRDGNELKVAVDGVTAIVSDRILPDSLWNEEIANRSEVLDSDNGQISRMHVESLGTESLVARGKTVPARRYRIAGDLECEVWYNEAGTLVHIRFKGSDGSNIDYVLQ